MPLPPRPPLKGRSFCLPLFRGLPSTQPAHKGAFSFPGIIFCNAMEDGEHNCYIIRYMQDRIEDLEQLRCCYQSAAERHYFAWSESSSDLPELYIVFLCNYDYYTIWMISMMAMRLTMGAIWLYLTVDIASQMQHHRL